MFLHIKLEVHGLDDVIALLTSINRKQDKIMATQQEEADKINAFADQLDKATKEIVDSVEELKTALANAGQTSPEVDAATARLGAASQKLDDLNEDKPVGG